MRHRVVGSKGSVVVALVAAGALLGCGNSSGGRDAAATATAEGVYGVYFNVTVSRPQNGTVRSTDGQIACGPAGGALNACGPVRYAWAATATLSATPATGYGFQGWAGDCQGTGACVLSKGADRYVVAIFAPAGQVGHGNYTSPAVHGPAYLDTLGGVPGALGCATAQCHGVSLQGVGIAPSCHTCHAQAGWTSWQTNCSFCHGATTAAAKAGYDVAASPTLSAPPDAVAQRLGGAAAPARTGAHRAHLTGVSSSGATFSAPFSCATCHAVPTGLSHVRGSSARAVVALSGAGQGQLPASLGTYDAATGTCATSCHGAGGSPAWASTTAIACGSCHALPPAPATGHPGVSSDPKICAACHGDTVASDGTLKASGKHVNGSVDVAGGTGGAGCAACHGYPPASGAHAAHFGLTGSEATGGYADVTVLQDRYPTASPTSAPAVYAFGCGLCHSLDASKHMNGAVDVKLYEASAPAGSLKARNAPTAAYDEATGTCSGVYCHSSGQGSPTFVVTPAWTSGAKLGCAGCHTNPPAYASGGPGAANANGHVILAEDGYEMGHFGGIEGPYWWSKHGYGGGVDASPITCQTCHFQTTDPTNTGSSGFYYLDTTGNYQLPGGDPGRYTYQGGFWFRSLQCTYCHQATGNARLGTGKVLPLRHVNGARDVVFDPRTTLPAIPWLPAAPATPVGPYWVSQALGLSDWPSTVHFNGSTISFDLASSRYDPATKTCTNVACHMAENPRWGGMYDWSWNACSNCHPNY